MKRSQKSVSDLGAAAYILMNHFKVIGRKGKDIFFALSSPKYTEQYFDQLKLDYLSSEFHRFDACIMSLKKLEDYPFENRGQRFTTDLGAAAYLLMNKYRIIGKRGRAVYFDIDGPEDKFDEDALEYVSSDFHRFDSCLMSLKKIGEYISDQE
jgi:hypothetical protein